MIEKKAEFTELNEEDLDAVQGGGLVAGPMGLTSDGKKGIDVPDPEEGWADAPIGT